MKFKKTMKKDSLQKVFRRYIGIYDNIVFEKSGEHLKEDIIDKIQKQVDSLFEKYENIEEISDYINFSEKLIIIIKDVIENASAIGKSLHMQALNELYAKKDLEILETIVKNVEESALKNGIIPSYFPGKNTYERLASKYGYRVFVKNEKSLRKKSLDKIDESLLNETLLNRKQQEYFDFLNDEPIFFTKAVIDEYFKSDNFEQLCLCKNSVKNQIISFAIHTNDTEKLKEKFVDISKSDNSGSSSLYGCQNNSTILSAYDMLYEYKKYWNSDKNSAIYAIYNEALWYCKDELYKTVISRKDLQTDIVNICEYILSYCKYSEDFQYYLSVMNYINSSETLSDIELVKIYNILRKIKINQEDLLNRDYAKFILDTILLLIANVKNNSDDTGYNIVDEYVKKDPTYYEKDEIIDIDLLIYLASIYDNMLKNPQNVEISENMTEEEIDKLLDPHTTVSIKKKNVISRIKEKIVSIFDKLKNKIKIKR